MSLSQRAQSFWAKSNEDIKNAKGKKVGEKQDTWIPLITHLLDVAACAAVVLKRDEKLQLALARDLGLELRAVVPWVAALAGLHDIGKAFPMFQLKWYYGAPQNGESLMRNAGFTWSTSEIEGDQVYHGVVSQVVLSDLFQKLNIGVEASANIADAIGAHHGFRAGGKALSRAKDHLGNTEWEAARAELFKCVLDVTKASHYPVPSVEELSGEAFMRLAGLVSFSDWLGSNRRWFGASRQISDVVALFDDATLRAEQALTDVGWPEQQTNRPTFSDLFGFTANDLQTSTIELLSAQTEPTLLIIEAPMGEGKTEAALYGHLLLQRNMDHRGFYVALPTQATGNAMFQRVKDEFLAKLGYTQAPDLQLLHGAAILDSNFQQMRLDIGETPQDTVVAREWFTQKKEGMLSPHAVGTVDQALMSVLNVSHQFVRLYGLGNRTIILDEVHAYEMYTSTLIERLLTWLRAVGSSVMLLSATLPESVRARLASAYGSGSIDDDTPYPRITRVNSRPSEVRGLEVKERTYALADAPLRPSDLAHFLLEQSKEGGAVGCVMNTVQRAQDLYRELMKLSPEVPVRLIHARVPSYKRRLLERWALRFLGKHYKAQRNVIVIGTSVLEQSLDIDFDVLISDLAPIDLLVQRAGRLHRHSRERPSAHTTARLYVSGLQPDADKPEISEYFWDYIYDAAVLLRTWAVIKNRSSISLPRDFQSTPEEPSLLEQVYSTNSLSHATSDAFQSELEVAEQKLFARLEHERNAAKAMALPTPSKFFDHPVDDDKREDTDDPAMNKNLRPVTRLGDPSVLVVFLHKREESLQLMKGTPVSLDKKPTLAEAKMLLQHAVSIGNKDLFYHLLDKPVSAWKKSSLLRHARVIELEGDGYKVSDKLTVQLDDVLGVVYERSG